jgi:hypothetical protein
MTAAADENGEWYLPLTPEQVGAVRCHNVINVIIPTAASICSETNEQQQQSWSLSSQHPDVSNHFDPCRCPS